MKVNEQQRSFHVYRETCVCVCRGGGGSTAGTFTDVQSGPNEQEGDWLEGGKKEFLFH